MDSVSGFCPIIHTDYIRKILQLYRLPQCSRAAAKAFFQGQAVAERNGDAPEWGEPREFVAVCERTI